MSAWHALQGKAASPLLDLMGGVFYVLIALALITSVSEASPVKKAGSEMKWTCESRDSLAKSSRTLSRQLEMWAKNQGAHMEKLDFESSREGQMVKLFAAYLLPASSPFRQNDVQCWKLYSDFTQSLSGKSEKESRDAFESWDACVSASRQPLPREATELKQCWSRASNAALKSQPTPSR